MAAKIRRTVVHGRSRFHSCSRLSSMDHPGNLFVVAAPSGSGKSSLVNALLEVDAGVAPSISHTTRAPRGQEKDGREYFFIDDQTFDEGQLVKEMLALLGRAKAEDLLDEDRAADHEDERAEHPPLLPLDAALGEVGADAGGEGFVDGHGSSLSDGERCAPSRRSAAGGLAPEGAVTDLW